MRRSLSLCLYTTSLSGSRIQLLDGIAKNVSTDVDACRDLSKAVKTITSKGTKRMLDVSQMIRKRLSDYKDLGVPIDTRTYGIALTLSASAKSPDLCDEIFAEMKSKRVDPTVADYNQMLKVHALCKNYSTVEYFWRLLCETPGLEPDEVSHLYFLRYVAATKPVKEIISEIEAAEARFKYDSDKIMMLYSTVAPVLPPKVGFDFLKRVKKPDLIMYSAVLASCSSEKYHNVLAAEKVVAAVTANGLKPDVAFFNKLLQVYVVDGNFKAAMKVLKQMSATKNPPNVSTYRLAIRACREEAAGDPTDQAVTLARLLFESAYKSGWGSYATIYMSMLELFLSIDSRSDFTEMVNRMKHHRMIRGNCKRYIDDHIHMLIN